MQIIVVKFVCALFKNGNAKFSKSLLIEKYQGDILKLFLTHILLCVWFTCHLLWTNLKLWLTEICIGIQ